MTGATLGEMVDVRIVCCACLSIPRMAVRMFLLRCLKTYNIIHVYMYVSFFFPLHFLFHFLFSVEELPHLHSIGTMGVQCNNVLVAFIWLTMQTIFSSNRHKNGQTTHCISFRIFNRMHFHDASHLISHLQPYAFSTVGGWSAYRIRTWPIHYPQQR